MNIRIRPAQTTDASSYRCLRERLDEETEFWGAEPGERFEASEGIKEFLENVVNDSRSNLFLAVDEEERVVGFLLARANVWRRRHSVLVDVGVVQAWAGQGIGTKLFTVLEEWAQSAGITRLELLVMTHNYPGIHLYKKMGFEIEGTKRASIVVNGKKIDEFLMAKSLK